MKDLYCYDLHADRKQLLLRDVTNVEMIDESGVKIMLRERRSSQKK
ncbi:hypothetical protein [Dysgonomonas mossii]